MAHDLITQSRLSILAKEIGKGTLTKKKKAFYAEKWGWNSRTISEMSRRAKAQTEQVVYARAAKAVESITRKETHKMLTKSQKQDILRQIAEGSFVAEKIYIVGGQITSVYAKPDHADILKAIELDNKMSGDYAVERKELTLKQGLPVTTWANDSEE